MLLEGTVTAIGSIEQKMFILLGACLTLMNALGAYVVSHYDSALPFHSQGAPVFMAVLYIPPLFYCSYLLGNALRPTKYYFPGNNPETLLARDVIVRPYDKLVSGETDNYQTRIQGNRKELDRMADALESAVRIFIWSPAAVLAATFLTNLAVS